MGQFFERWRALEYKRDKLTWQLQDERTTVAAWIKNIADTDDHLIGGVPTVGVARTTSVAYAPPRSYGVDVTYRFGN